MSRIEVRKWLDTKEQRGEDNEKVSEYQVVDR
jgi:hypothetical protein